MIQKMKNNFVKSIFVTTFLLPERTLSLMTKKLFVSPSHFPEMTSAKRKNRIIASVKLLSDAEEHLKGFLSNNFGFIVYELGSL